MSDGCAGCRERDATIAELEEALEGAAFVLSRETDDVQAALGLSLQQAQATIILHRRGSNWILGRELALTLPRIQAGPKARIDSEFRCERFMHPLVAKIRKRCGKDFVESSFYGYRLSETARATVAEILGSAA